MPISRWFNKVASVFVESDDFQAAVKTDLACMLSIYQIDGSATGSDRAELMAARLLTWDQSYAMPEGSQVQIDGVRWQLPRGGIGYPERRAMGVLSHGRAHVVRAV